MGTAGHLGEVLDLFANSYFPLGLHVDSHLGTREGNNTFHKDLWLSIQYPRPAAGNQIGSALPKELRALWLYHVFFPLYFPLCNSSLLFPQESQLPSPQLYQGPDALLPPSFIPPQPHHFSFVNSLGGSFVLSSTSWRGCTLPRQMAAWPIFNCLQARRFHNLF